MEKILGIILIMIAVLVLIIFFKDYVLGCLGCLGLLIIIPSLLGLGLIFIEAHNEKKDIQLHLPGSYVIEEDEKSIARITFSDDGKTFTITPVQDDNKKITGKYKIKVTQGTTELSLVADNEIDTSWFKAGENNEEVFGIHKRKNKLKIYDIQDIDSPPIKIYGSQFSNEPDWYFKIVE